MRDEEHRESEDVEVEWEDDLDVDIVDLALSDDTNEPFPKTAIPSWSVKPVLRWQNSFNRRRWRFISITCSLLLVCLVLALNLRTTLAVLTNARTIVTSRLIKQSPTLNERLPPPVNIAPSLVIPLSQVGFSCITSEAWFPDSTAIALLGYEKGCEYDTDNAVGLATIQDAHTGKRIARLQPDTLIKKTFYTQFPAIHDNLVFNYQSALWSPDKVHLAFLFTLHTKSQIGSAGFSGVLVFDLKQRSTRVLLHLQENQSEYQISASSYMEWDTQRGITIPTPQIENSDPFVFSSSIPVAEEYTWGSNGELMPQTHETFRSSDIGSTNGSPSFTVWQPGGVELVKQDQSGGITFEPGIFVWDVDFIAWSPDGRYLINDAFLAARLEPPGYPRPDQKTLVAFHMENLPILPVRDAALLSALKLISSAHTIGTFYHMIVSWSPNGQLMGMTSYEFLKKNLYSTKRGYLVATLQAPKTDALIVQGSHEGYFAFSSPNWSPDSTRILAQDPTANAVVVWNIPSGLK
ncbi:MAG: hypothetical protein NVS4B12_05420 [Ktedonobacteraceae bacterium]